MILAIDPGLSTGWAIIDGVLIDAGLGDPPINFRGEKVIIEKPQVYPRSPARPNDLITLALQAGGYAERFASRGLKVEYILPHCWKGSIDPTVCLRRIVASLSPTERTVLESKGLDLANPEKGKQHNVIDAVGLGKWSLKRARAAVF